MHHTAHPLAPLSTWVVVPTTLRHLLMPFMQVSLERRMWLLTHNTHAEVSQLLNGLQPLSVVLMLTQTVQCSCQ